MKKITSLCIILLISSMFYGCGKKAEVEILLEVELYCSYLEIYIFRLDSDNYLSVSRTIEDNESKQIELSDETVDKIHKLATETMKIDPNSFLYGGSDVNSAYFHYDGEIKSYMVFANDIYGENTAAYDLVELLVSLSPINIIKINYR